ncbi:hypothetical protein J3F84DRAFT_357142 [Trichoderma pleuroticola]
MVLFRIVETHPYLLLCMGGQDKSASAEPERTMSIIAFSLVPFSFRLSQVRACMYMHTDRRSSAGGCVIACAKMVMEACASFLGLLVRARLLHLYMHLLTGRGQPP